MVKNIKLRCAWKTETAICINKGWDWIHIRQCLEVIDRWIILSENEWWLKLIDKELHYDNRFVWIYGTENNAKNIILTNFFYLQMSWFYSICCLNLIHAKIFEKQTFVKSESCIYVYKYHFSCYSIQLQHCHLIVYINLQLTNAIYSIAKKCKLDSVQLHFVEKGLTIV